MSVVFSFLDVVLFAEDSIWPLHT